MVPRELPASPAEAVSLEQVRAFRWRAQQLDTAPASRGSTDADLLDYGVQDTGPDGARWALQLRGCSPAPAPASAPADEHVLVWTLRGAPHLYRRADAAEITVATAPYSEADAAKRIFDASTPLKRAGTGVLDSLTRLASAERALVTGPLVKGELSTRLTPLLEESQRRCCRPCNAVHSYEMPFRLAALQAGLELEQGSSPPVLRRIPGMRPRPFARLAGEAVQRFDVVRNYVRFFGPARVRDCAAYLDAPLADVRAHWPQDAVAVSVRRPGDRRPEPEFVLAADLDRLAGPVARPAGTTRLLGPYDAYLQGRDRETLVADEARRQGVWRVLGRPGAVAVDGAIVGTWRPRTSGRKLTVLLDPWAPLDARLTAAIRAEAERLAGFRGVVLASMVQT